MAAIARNAIKAPFVWFGGKSRQAETVWRYFGADVSNYVEPFAGTIAVLLGRPGGAGKLETINDRDCYVANVWRSIQHDPYGVAAYCDYPISEVDLHARHQWLVQHLRDGADFRERMLSDPDHYDAKKAGWWLWGISQWIGGGWCREPGQGDVAKGRRPNLHNSAGVHQKIPDLYARGNGRGICCAAPERDSADAYEPPTKHQIPALHGKRGTEAPPHRSRRKREVRPRTESINRMTNAEREEMLRETDYPEDVWRPRTRGECVYAPRPCPFISCVYNLYLDVSPKTGSIKLNFPDLEPWEMPPRASCTLDVADRGGTTLEGLGAIMNLTRERIRQIEVMALVKIEALHDDVLADYADPGPVGKHRLPVVEDNSEDESVDETCDDELDADWDVAEGWG